MCLAPLFLAPEDDLVSIYDENYDKDQTSNKRFLNDDVLRWYDHPPQDNNSKRGSDKHTRAKTVFEQRFRILGDMVPIQF